MMNKAFFTQRNDMSLTLFELDNAVPGVVYDVFDSEFAVMEGSSTAHYRAFISLKNPSDISLEGEIIDSTGKEISKLSSSKAVKAVSHSIEGSLEVSGEVWLRVRARYTLDTGAVQSPELTLPLTPKLPDGSHRLEHPTKRKPGEPVRRYGDQQKKPDMSWGLSRDTKYVVTVLNRDPSDTKDIDYLCCWGFADGTHPYFGLPGKGSITGPKNGKFLPDHKLLSATCILYPREKSNGGGILTASANSVVWDSGSDRLKSAVSADGAKYEITAGDITFSSTKSAPNVALYEFVGAWQGHTLVYDEKEKQGKYFDYELKLNLPFQIPNQKNPSVYNVIVTSRDIRSPVALVDRSVLPVKIMYGCFAKGSMVLTSGGEKAIEDINIGDMVSTPDGETEVLNVWRGREENMILIEADGGSSITVTPDHPMLTERGFVRACDLNAASDRLIRDDGPVGIKCIDIITYKDAVYNLETKSSLIVNRFVTGDASAQNEED